MGVLEMKYLSETRPRWPLAVALGASLAVNVALGIGWGALEAHTIAYERAIEDDWRLVKARADRVPAEIQQIRQVIADERARRAPLLADCVARQHSQARCERWIGYVPGVGYVPALPPMGGK